MEPAGSPPDSDLSISLSHLHLPNYLCSAGASLLPESHIRATSGLERLASSSPAAIVGLLSINSFGQQPGAGGLHHPP